MSLFDVRRVPCPASKDRAAPSTGKQPLRTSYPVDYPRVKCAHENTPESHTPAKASLPLNEPKSEAARRSTLEYLAVRDEATRGELATYCRRGLTHRAYVALLPVLVIRGDIDHLGSRRWGRNGTFFSDFYALPRRGGIGGGP